MQLLQYALGTDVTHGDHQRCNKIKPHSILWIIFSNFTSWIFHCIPVTPLVNVCHYTFCHKHIVVPSVASGKSVKSRPPLICCSVAESLFFECELKNFEAVRGHSGHFSQLCIMYSMTPASAQCGLHSSGVNSEE